MRLPWTGWTCRSSTLAAWAAAFALLGTVLGSIASDVGGFLDNPESRKLILDLGGVDGLTDAFLAAELGFAGVLASAYGIQAAARLRSEEVAQRAEPLLATGVTRSRWLASHVLIALASCALLLTVTGCAAGLALAAQGGSSGAGFGALLGAALVRVPAAWVLTCIAVAVFGVAPRAVVAAWGALVAFLLLGEFGTVLGLAPAVQDLSPSAHVPPLPGGDFSATPVVGLSVVAAALLAASVAGFRRRDIG